MKQKHICRVLTVMVTLTLATSVVIPDSAPIAPHTAHAEDPTPTPSPTPLGPNCASLGCGGGE